MKKVLLINSYSLDKIYLAWKENKSPGHYLFGKIDLEKMGGYHVDILAFEKYKILNFLGKFIRINFLDQQIRALFIMHKYDIIYAPFPLSNTRLLALFKMLGLIKTPFAVLGHQNLYEPPAKGKTHGFKKTLLLQYDKIAFLSKELLEKTKQDLDVSTCISNNKFTHISWGAEKEFYSRRLKSLKSEESNFVICAGTTDRDFELIIEIFREIDFPLEIYCTPNTRPNVADLPKHITINSSFIPYSDLLERYRQARIIFIPLKIQTVNSGRTLGLTVILDALAIGKPVIMTKNNYLDIDPKDRGFGLSIPSHDVNVWREEILKVIFDYEKLDRMGINANKLFFEKYNSENFGIELGEIFNSINP